MNKLENIVKYIQRVMEYVRRNIQFFYLFNRIYYYFIIKKVEYYQPLYDLSFFKNQIPKRMCHDRADAILQALNAYGRNARLLDVGCSLGYFSFFFSERGYRVTGIDASRDNIEICQFQNRQSGRSVQFSVSDFSNAFIETHGKQFDVVIILSVLHHLIAQDGLFAVQQMMAKLLETTPILVVELALKSEEVDFPWKASLPDNALAIFDLCTDLTIENHGYFNTHLSAVRRPLYLVRKNSVRCHQKTYSIDQFRMIAQSQATSFGRQYYMNDEFFIKKYFLLHDFPDNERQILREIDHYQRLPRNNYFPTLLDFAAEKDQVTAVFNKLPGETLDSLLKRRQPLNALSIFVDIVKGLEYLYEHGLYHNDIRLWNILIHEQRAYLIDLGLSGDVETENTNIALLWLIFMLHHFQERVFINPITQYPSFHDGIPVPFDAIISVLESTSSFKVFLEWFNGVYPHEAVHHVASHAYV